VASTELFFCNLLRPGAQGGGGSWVDAKCSDSAITAKLNLRKTARRYSQPPHIPTRAAGGKSFSHTRISQRKKK
jgi:hypothetical protein